MSRSEISFSSRQELQMDGAAFFPCLHLPFSDVDRPAWIKRPFTPSQWMELEHQAMIYKCIKNKSPIPSNLLNAIVKGLHRSSPGTAGGWKPTLGLSLSGDAELTRCRRTDGKKWRCSNEVLADQKYCERHINHNRHRSRKLVEQKSPLQAVGDLLHFPPDLLGLPNCSKKKQKRKAQQEIRSSSDTNPDLSLMNPRAVEPARDTQCLLSHFQQYSQFENSSKLGAEQKYDDQQLQLNNSGGFHLQNAPRESNADSSFQSYKRLQDYTESDLSQNSPVSWPEPNKHHQTKESQLHDLFPSLFPSFAAPSSPTSQAVPKQPTPPLQKFLPEQGSPPWEMSLGGPLGEILAVPNNADAQSSKNSAAGRNISRSISTRYQ